MIVDDEPLILAGIVSMLDWEAHQCKIVGKAVNGQQALARMKELRPDIVITDIKMPAMDGIRYMKEAKDAGEGAEFILLTNLEDFTLAREAIRLGAVDYLVKLELSEEKLAEAVSRVVSRCEKKRSGDDRGKGYIGETLEEKIGNYFRRLLLFESEPKADEQLVQKIEEKFRNPIVMMINFNHGASEAFTRQDQIKAMNFAEDIIEEMVKGFFDDYCVIRREQDGFVLVLSTKEMKDYKSKIRKMGGKFLTVLKDYFETTACIAVSEKGEGRQDFQELLYQASSAMNCAYYEYSDPIVFYSQSCESNGRRRSSFDISFMKKELVQAVRHNESQIFYDLLNQLITLFEEYKPSKSQAINACSNLYYLVSSMFEERGEEEFPYMPNLIGDLNSRVNIKDIVGWLVWFRDGMVKFLERRQNTRTDKNVRLAQNYVSEHYQQKLTLSQMADYLGLSQGYFSSVFKKHTGKNFTDYVTEFKVEKAKELIASHQYRMYEISDLLGFDTQYYFSTVFKKVTGWSPKEYENLVVMERTRVERERQ